MCILYSIHMRTTYAIVLVLLLSRLCINYPRAETDYWCVPSQVESFPKDSQWLDSRYQQCRVPDVDYGNFSSYQQLRNSQTYQDALAANASRPCLSWEYDRSFWRNTIIQEWDLVCQRESWRKWTQQVTFFGLLIGVLVCGVLSDRFGRVKAMLLLLTMNIVFGTCSAFSPTYPLFLVGAWGCGFSSIGFGTVLYCWIMELVAGKQKTVLGCLPHLNFAFWGLVIAGIAWAVPDWRKMELIFSLPLVLLYCVYWVLPESPRWLLTHGHVEEAEKILHSVAKFNGQPLPEDFRLQLYEHHGKGKGILGFLELFKTPNLRARTLIIYYLWFATTLVYYGLTLNSNDKDSLFTYYSLGKAMEFPAVTLVIVLLMKAGRRITLLSLFFVCGVSLILSYFVPEHVLWLRILLNVFARGCSNGCLCLCYVYSAEVYPTVIRNTGLGSSSFWARIGPMIAPYISDLKSVDSRVPSVIFGFAALLASFFVTFLPETAHHMLPDTIQEGEEMGKGDTFYSYLREKFKFNKASEGEKSPRRNASNRSKRV